MSKKKLILSIFISAILLSCNNEPIGSLLEPKFSTGCTCTGSGEYNVDNDNLLTNFVISNDLPNNHDLSYLLPPIMSQGQQGSCVSWAISYYMKSLQEKIEHGSEFTYEKVTSPAYTYNQITQGNCSGTQLVTTLELLKQKGVCSLISFPYSDTECDLQPTNDQDKQALENRIGDYKSLSGENMVNEMKGLIYQQTPIIIAAYLSEEFGKIDDFGLSAYREHKIDYNLERCHAMLVVGYSDNYNAFKVVNSWGRDWGDDGFVWIDYAAFDNVSDENAQFRVINEAYVAFDLE